MSAAAVAASVAADPRVLVVLDDDPTGTQSVSSLPVLTRWEQDDFVWAFTHRIEDQPASAVYVLTNTRSLDAAEAAERNRQVVTSALAAAAQTGTEIGFVSRSDSTLRGHFPLETDVIAATLREVRGRHTDGVVIVPAFPDAGRVTINSVHYMRDGDSLTPVTATEFAADATFGFSHANLAEYVQEKTAGRVRAEDVLVLDLSTVRGGAPGIADRLSAAHDETPIVVDIVTENDLRALALGLAEAESRGQHLLYRVGPPFVRARIGQEERSPLSAVEAFAGATPAPGGGLIVVGSHVGLTTRQLAKLTERRPHAHVVQIDVEALLDEARAGAHLDGTVADVVSALATGDVIVQTSRLLVRADDAAASLRIARTVSDAVVAVVDRTLAVQRPRFVIAKGGITSSDVATRGLQIRRALVLGPMLPGIVSLWRPIDGPADGIPYVVFAGNVGSDESLADVVDTLSAASAASAPAALPFVVTVLGLGAMGLPMATRLAQKLTVHGFDIAAERLALAEAAGIVRFESARDAARGADAVLLAVRNAEQLDQALFGPTGVAEVLSPGAVVILTSTVGTDSIADVVARLADYGVALVDAPLSGGPIRAGEGDLLIVVGATPAARNQAGPVLELLASTLTVVGDRPGDGQALKTVNQLLCGIHIAAAAEALALADALGLDPARTLEALGAGAAGSFMLSNRGPRILQAYDDEGAAVLSRLDIFVKDMGIVGKATRAAGLPSPVAAAAEQLYLLGQAQGLGALDDSAVIRVVAPSRREA